MRVTSLKQESQTKASNAASAAKGFAGSRDMDMSALADGGMALNLDDDRIPAYMVNNQRDAEHFSAAWLGTSGN